MSCNKNSDCSKTESCFNGKCQTNLKCTDGCFSNQYCDQSVGLCANYASCSTIPPLQACEGPMNCIAGTCQPQASCSTDQDCQSHSLNQICTNNKCTVVECTSKYSCDKSSNYYSDCVNNKCTPRGGTGIACNKYDSSYCTTQLLRYVCAQYAGENECEGINVLLNAKFGQGKTNYNLCTYDTLKKQCLPAHDPSNTSVSKESYPEYLDMISEGMYCKPNTPGSVEGTCQYGCLYIGNINDS